MDRRLRVKFIGPRKLEKGRSDMDKPKKIIIHSKWLRELHYPIMDSGNTYKNLIYKPNGKKVKDLTGKVFFEYELVE